VLSRWPYRARLLYNWDAVQFALALGEFDVAKHQPHPPGYLLYVGLGRLVNRALDDPAATYGLLAVVFSGGATALLYALARALYDRPTALAAAALLAGSPLFWFYGSVGLTYAGEAFAAVLVALVAQRALRGRGLAAGAVVLGLSGGLRPSVLVLLLPLWAGSAALGAPSALRLAGAFGVLGLAVLSWLVPLVWLSGGWAAYLTASTQLYGSVVLPTSILGGTPEVTLVQARYLLESVAAGLGPLAVLLPVLPLWAIRRGWTGRESFLLAWILPPAAFYLLVHFGQAGYVLTFLPALVVLLARLLVEGAAAGAAWLCRPRWRWALTALAVAPLVLLNSAFFVSARPVPRDFDRPPAEPWLRRARDEAQDSILSRTAAALREHEAVIRTYVDAIRAGYDPWDTVLLTELGNPRSYPWLRHAMYYLREFPIYQIALGAGAPRGYYAPQSAATMVLTPGSTITLPRRVRRLVWFVDHWDPGRPRPRGLREVALPYGRYLYVLPLGARPVEHAGYRLVRERR
jgi:hypothetical protein